MVDVADYKRRFISTKLAQLLAVGREQRTQREAIAAMRRKYVRLLADFLRVDGSTYGIWLELGPKPEWDEVLAAAEDPAVWDRLVEKCHGR